MYHANNRPWINKYFTQLVTLRREAFTHGFCFLYRKLRNQVNRVSKNLKSQYYIDQVEHWKSDKPNNWWKLIKQLTGVVTTRKQEECFVNLTVNNTRINSDDLTETVNTFFVSIAADSLPVDIDIFNDLHNSLGIVSECFIELEISVYCALKCLKASKSSRDNVLNNRLLIELADVLAAPIGATINSSIRQGISTPLNGKLPR
jgi:hypothetical protein